MDTVLCLPVLGPPVPMQSSSMTEFHHRATGRNNGAPLKQEESPSAAFATQYRLPPDRVWRSALPAYRWYGDDLRHAQEAQKVQPRPTHCLSNRLDNEHICGYRRRGARRDGCGAQAARRPADVTAKPRRFPVQVPCRARSGSPYPFRPGPPVDDQFQQSPASVERRHAPRGYRRHRECYQRSIA